MTRCNSTSDPLNATGDIVGYGILAAFLGSALVTIFAVLLAYYYDAIDDDLMTDLDDEFKNEVRTIIRKRKASVKNVLKGSLGRAFRQTEEHSTARSDAQTRDDLRERRAACFNQFVLSLSDQQLVTGLALLIITVSSQDNLSGYEFSVAHSLAWFSSTTHLATLDVLRPTLRSQNRWVLAIRVFGMFLLLILLTYTSYRVSREMSASKLPASCTRWHIEAGAAASRVIQPTLVLLIIWSGYTSRLLDICLQDKLDPWAPITSILVEKSPEPRVLTQEQQRQKRIANRRCNMLLRIQGLENENSSFLSFFKFATRLTLGIFDYNRAFISTIPMISFSFSYGVSQVVSYAFLSAPTLTEEAREMGFGQLMALFLLLLPCLAAGEVYGDYQNQKLRARSAPANVTLVAGTQTMERTQRTRDPYQINFEHVKKYLFTAAEDPCEIPEDRRDVLYGEFVALTHIELRLRKRGSASRLSQLVLLHAFLSFMYAIFFVNIEPGIYYVGFSVFLLWVLFVVPDFLMGLPASSKMSPAQRIYVETERLVEESQRTLSSSGTPSSSA